MDTSESNSIKSVGTPSTPKTPSSGSKKVGFAPPRPHLIIPTPPDYRVSGATPNTVYFKRQSVFFFDQLHGIKDFTKSGLGVGEKCAYWLYNKLKVWSKKWFTHMFLTIILVLYTVGGAYIFEAVEGAHEIAKKNKTQADLQSIDVRTSRIDLILKLRDLSLTIPTNSSDAEWTQQAQQLFETHKLTLIDNEQKKKIMEKEQKKKWSFFNAIVYCGTVYTSIGYGHIYPETSTGKALTIVYAIIGLPLFLIALTDFGKLFTRCIKFFWSFVRRVYYTGSCRRARKTAHVQDIFKGAQRMYDFATFRRPSAVVDDAENPAVQTETPATPAISVFEIDDEFNLPISLAIFILVMYIFFGAVIYCVWEGWAFFDSFYFVFISMATIGFGDMVPDDPACMIVSIVYLVFGLALMSMCINVVQVKLSDTFKRASSKIGATIGLSVVEEDGSIITVPPENVEIPPVHDAKVLANGTPTEALEDKSNDS